MTVTAVAVPRRGAARPTRPRRRRRARRRGAIVDLFAGPGGWDEGLRRLGEVDALGVELDGWACATRRAAGLPTLRADVAELDPWQLVAGERPDGLIASPPCQGFSTAGSGAGRGDLALLEDLARDLARGVDRRAEVAAAEAEAPDGRLFGWALADPRSVLALEPLRYALALRPRWVALEQVPPVLGLWRLYATLLAREGYATWTGVLGAEEYGVPQTRRRAFLLARRDGLAARPPAATHRAYEHGREQHEGDPALRPWVSMAEAIGWPVVDELVDVGNTRGGTRAHGRRRRAGRPAPTVTSRLDQLERRGDFAYERRQVGGDGRRVRPVPGSRPAPTLTVSGLARGRDVLVYSPAGRPPTLVEHDERWPATRPATTVAGDPRVHPPGHKECATDPPGRYEQRRGARAVRITVEQAARLQGFDEHPWQGPATARHEQVGNAVPPPLAAAVLGSLLGDATAARVVTSTSTGVPA